MNEELKNIFTLRVDEVLHYIWDPIGVIGAPEARDEYITYVPIVVDAIVNGQNIETVAKMLYEIETKNRLTDITSIEIDPTHRVADIDEKNNKIELRW